MTEAYGHTRTETIQTLIRKGARPTPIAITHVTVIDMTAVGPARSTVPPANARLIEAQGKPIDADRVADIRNTRRTVAEVAVRR